MMCVAVLDNAFEAFADDLVVPDVRIRIILDIRAVAAIFLR